MMGWRPWVLAIRPHHWLKNALVLVPALAAHHADALWHHGLWAMISFSLCASAGYVLNDLVDIRHDQSHPTKCWRPFAAGALSPWHGLLVMALLLGGAWGTAYSLPLSFLGILAGYGILTTLYTVWLKTHVVIDVVVLACLYGARLVAGGCAADVELSPWLMAMAVFWFLCLALIKRCTEIIDCTAAGVSNLAGRGYRSHDLPILGAMAAASGFVGVLVVALYINSPAVSRLYGHPDILWLVIIVLVYWLGRVLLLCHRGEMHDDPILFAATDRPSLASLVAIAAIIAASL